jgi:hypothetical protein
MMRAYKSVLKEEDIKTIQEYFVNQKKSEK